MNAIMIKGERSKLLAVAVVLAMVACALVAFMPATDAADTTETVADTEMPAAVYGVITLDNNVELSSMLNLTEDVTIDLAGFTLSVQGINVSAKVIIEDSSFDGTGTILKSSGSATTAAIEIDDGGILVVNGVNIDASNGDWYGVYAMTGSSVELNGTEISAKYSCISGNGTNNNANVELNDVVCDSTMTAAVFFPSTEKLIVTGGTFTGNSGFDIRAGTVTINNATINIDLTEKDWTGTSGPSAFGMGVAVFDHKSYGDVIDVTVSGCTIKNAVYDYYVGGLNLADGNANMDSSSAGYGPDGFDGSTLGEKYKYNDTITLKIPGYSFDSKCGYQFVANDVTGTSFTVPEGIVIDGTVSFVDGETFTVSNVKAAGENGLTISKGSIVLTGEMTAAEAQKQIEVAVTAGETQIKLDDLTITSGTLALDGDVSITGAVSVAAGAGLNLTDAKVDTASNGSIANKGTVTGGEKIPSSVTVDNDGIMTSQGTDSQTYEVGNFDAFLTAVTTANAKVYLSKEIVMESGAYVETGVSIYLNGNYLDTNGNNLNITRAALLDIPSDSVLTISATDVDAGVLKYAATSIITTYVGSTIVLNGSMGSASAYFNNSACPSFVEGTILKFQDRDYTVYRSVDNNTPVYYAIAVSNPTYNPDRETMVLDDIDVNAIVLNVNGESVSAWNQTIRYDFTNQPHGVTVTEEGYPLSIQVQISLSQNDTVLGVTKTVGYRVLPLDSEVDFDDNGNDKITVAVDENDDTKITVSGDVVWNDETKQYEVVIGIDCLKPFEGAVLTVDGQKFEEIPETITLSLGTDLSDVNDIIVTYDADGGVLNYAETEYTITFSNLKASADVTFGAITDDTMDLYGKKASDLQKNVTIDDDNMVSGTINWVYGYTGYWEGTDSTAVSHQMGYYLAYNVFLPDGFENWNGVSVKSGDYSADGVNKIFDGYFVTEVDGKSTIKIKIDLDGDGTVYGEQTYTIDLSGVTFESPAEYYDNGLTGSQTETHVFEGKEIQNVNGMTFFINWNNTDSESKTIRLYQGSVEKNVVVYEDTLNWATGSWTACFSYYNQILKYQTSLENPDYVLTPGLYVIQITDAEGNVLADSGDLYVYGSTGAGYGADKATAISGMEKAGYVVDPDDVDDMTMWAVWYGQQYSSVTATVSFDGKEIYSQDDGDIPNWNNAGLHGWYFTFNDTNDHFIGAEAKAGAYTIKIVGYDEVHEEEVTIVDTVVYIGGQAGAGFGVDKSTAVGGMTDAGYPVDPDDVADELNVWLVWYNATDLTGEFSAELTLDGTVIYKESIDSWNTIGVHGWYFTFDESNDSNITKNPLWPTGLVSDPTGMPYGSYVATVYDADDNPVATISYDNPDPNKYNVFFNEQYVDENNDGIIYDFELVFESGDRYKLPNTNTDMTLECWQLVVDGQVVNTFNAGGEIVFGQIRDDTGELVTSHDLEFRAKYVTGSGDSGDGDDPETPAEVQLIGGAFFADASQAKLAMVSLGSTYTGYVDANTIFVVYAQNGYSDAAMTLQVFYGGEPLLSTPETMISADGIRTALFSFENQLKDKLQAGDYTFVLYADDEQVADFIVSIAPSDIPVEPEDPETPVDPVYRTEYEVSAEIVDGKLQITVRSDETGAEFINLDGTFYYTYEAYDSAWRAVDLGIADKDLISKTITANGKVCTETKLVDISGLEAGLHINVQLMVATNGVQFLLDEFNFTVGTIETAGVEADAGDVIEAVETASGIALDPEGVADETVYAVFEADAGTYTCSLSNADGVRVYAEELTFAKDGAHVWYFSLIETEPSWNPEYPGIIDALEEGEIVDGEYIVTVVDAENNTIFTGSIELTA